MHRIQGGVAVAALVAIAACKTSTAGSSDGHGGGGAGPGTTTGGAGGQGGGPSSSASSGAGTSASSSSGAAPGCCDVALDQLEQGMAVNVATVCADGMDTFDQVIMCEMGTCATDCPGATMPEVQGWSAACVACMTKADTMGGCATAVGACAHMP